MPEESTMLAPNTEQLERDGHDACTRARGIIIRSAEDYVAAGDFLKQVKGIRQNIADTLSAPIRKAYEAHKAMLAAKAKHDKPLEDAERTVKTKMADYSRQQELERQRKEAELRAAALKQEEDRRLAHAAELEAAGDKQAAEELIEQPMQPPPVVLQSEAPKVAGISTSETWDFEIYDEGLIPREYMIPNEKALRALAKALKGQAKVSGVRFFAVSVVSVRA